MHMIIYPNTIIIKHILKNLDYLHFMHFQIIFLEIFSNLLNRKILKHMQFYRPYKFWNYK